MRDLTDRDRERYARQMAIPGWGDEAQRRLENASVAVVGAGGLGSTVAVQLVAAGVGRLILADHDSVEPGNLNRQFLHWEEDVGRPKADSARTKLRRMNSALALCVRRTRVTEENAAVVLKGADAVVDALDNIGSRLVLNRYCLNAGIPLFHGAVWGLEGRVMTMLPGTGACLACLYETAPDPGITPVAGATAALIGAIQAAECIKYLTGLGTLLRATLLLCDLSSGEFTRLRVYRRPDCPACGGSNAAPGSVR